jgi:hypothetical protein
MLKKKYVKPMIEFESYKVDSMVYTVCSGMVPLGSQECSTNVDGINNVFNVCDTSSCEFDGASAGDKVSNDGYCYHVPQDNMQYFGGS